MRAAVAGQVRSVEVLRIPAAEFALVYLFAAIAWLPVILHKFARSRGTR